MTSPQVALCPSVPRSTIRAPSSNATVADAPNTL
jgi:hypothetical protein